MRAREERVVHLCSGAIRGRLGHADHRLLAGGDEGVDEFRNASSISARYALMALPWRSSASRIARAMRSSCLRLALASTFAN